MSKIILHIDFDSFFASCEQQFNSLYRDKPLGIIAANSRSCIIAASKEAKVLGVKTGSRSFEAKKICPSIILTHANFVRYFDVSKKFLNICKDYSPEVELFSIDEVFIDLTKTAHLFNGVYRIVERIRKRIKTEIGEYITASFGISYNKLLAKLASGMEKPNGLVEIKPEDVEKVYQKVKLIDICGIGKRIKIRLNKIGIDSLLDLRKTSADILIREFGKAESYFLKNIAWGIDSDSVISYTTSPSVKSVGRNYCLPKNEYNQRIVLQNIYELCEEIGVKLRRLNKKAKTVGLSLRGFKNKHGRKTLKDYMDSGREIFLVCKELYDEWSWQSFNYKEDMVRMISVWAENLEERKNLPLPLFEDNLKKDRILKVVDKINKRFGDHTIRNGFLLYAGKLTTVPNGFLADKYERTKLAKESSLINC